MRVKITKSILWFLVGAGLTVLAMRILHGPGSVTALTDIIPWGLWKGGGVVALVAVGGAGFTLAMFVYVFGWRKYEPVVRGAVLLALMCYTSVGIGLTIDIGIWWRIVFPVFHWQIHSVLFEVAWCIMLYLGVLAFEFSHNAMEKFGWQRMLAVAHKLTIVFVIAGIALSTLHQSSLGTLFLATPFRLHPLWHTDFLPLLFFVSAIGIGCLTISVVTLLVHKLYGAKPPMDAIAGLGKIAAVVMAVYLVLRIAEVLVAGEGALLTAMSWDTANFWLELMLSAALPIVLLSFRRYRSSPSAMLWIGILGTVGLSLNRINVAGVATLSTTHANYLPSWTEWVVTLGVLAAATLFYLFAVEYFGLFVGVRPTNGVNHAPGTLDHTDGPALYFAAHRMGEARVYSLLFIVGTAASFGCLSDDAVFGVEPLSTPTAPPRLVATGDQSSTTLGAQPSTLGTLLLDGNRNDRGVRFLHDAHAARVRDAGGQCAACHHMNLPRAQASGCHECHSDMYLGADIFDHELHAEKLGGNDGCSQCHVDVTAPKLRANTKVCEDCHETMRAPRTLVKPVGPGKSDIAAGYMDAMHGLCVDCHERALGQPSVRDDLAQCATCHHDAPPGDLVDRTSASDAQQP